jgi:DNA-binding response OmpR family regulator
MFQILVVSNDVANLIDVLDVLTSAGYQASGAASFEEATRVLAHRSPDLVIADERLGEFNGLHIIVKARAGHPEVAGIVTTPAPNRGLEADARGLNVECVIKPHDPTEWLVPVWQTLNAGHPGEYSTVRHDPFHSSTRH